MTPRGLEPFVSATPLAASAALGLGPYAEPFTRRDEPASLAATLGAMVGSRSAVAITIETAGHTARQLLSLLTWRGGSVTADVLRWETATADSDEIADAMGRLVDAGLVEARRETPPSWHLTLDAHATLAPVGISMHDQSLITADALATICRRLGLEVPGRKDQRIAAIAGYFADGHRREAIVGDLSAAARAMLNLVADGTPRSVSTVSLGLNPYDLHAATAPRSSYQRPPPPEVAPLAELAAVGILGVSAWEQQIWIWKEAWPLLGRPLYLHWPSVPRPATAPVSRGAERLPALISVYERALRRWEEVPPPALKNGDARLPKKDIRSTAKDLSTGPETVQIIADTALGLGLLLRNVVATSGRGRNRRVDEAWMPDPDVRQAWEATPAPARWARVVAEWANPRHPASHQQVANRHLVLWELGLLPAGLGFDDDKALSEWIEHRYLPTGTAEAASEALVDLRLLGLVSSSGAAGLTDLGRLLIEDPLAVVQAELGSADRATVQADLSIVCPPDLHPDLLVRIADVAVLESDAGASVFRLDEDRITAAVQAGRTEAEIVEFLRSLSTVPLPDTVLHLVADGAARAGRVRVMTATTVVVTDDPADLARACKVSAAKLTILGPTVAGSPLPAEKVRQALARKGLAPLMVNGGEERQVRRSAEDAERLEREAEYHRRFAERLRNPALEAEAQRLEAAARAARDPSSRLAVKGPIAVTPTLLERLR